MIKEFDDYKFKNISKKIRFSLKQKKCKFLSPWELSSFISSFNTNYYKTEVINTIGIALKQNISPKNILIFDESFKLNQQYTKLSKISLNDSDLKYLYTLGKPVSLIPNNSIFTLNLLFKYFRNINEFLYKIHHKTLDTKNLSSYFKIYQKSNFENLSNELKKDSKFILRKSNLKEKDLKIFDNIFKLMRTEYDTFHTKKDSIATINEIIKLENWSTKLNKNSNTYKKYFSRFYSLLTNIQRPVIAVYNEELQTINILCRAHINKQQHNAVTLDLKSITHNSPIEAVFNAGISVVSTFKEQKRADELHEFNKQLQEIEILKEKKYYKA